MNDKHLQVVMDKMFQAVGEPGWNKELTVKEDWYWTNEWTTDQEIEFKNWLEDYLKNGLKMNAKMAKSVSQGFVFSYGWKIKEGC